MSYFVAIKVPREGMAPFQKIQKAFAQFPAVRLLNRDLLHLTLNFLGDVEENDVLPVKEAIKRAVAGKPRFSCRGEKLCVFPSDSFFRVICVKLEKNDVLCEIQKDLASKICTEVESEKYRAGHGFVPHITFARVKSMQEKANILARMSAANNKARELSFDVKEIALMQSVFGPVGVTYRTLENFTLAD